MAKYRTVLVTGNANNSIQAGAPLIPNVLNPGYLIANNDTVNPIWISDNPGLSPNGSDTIQVPPLGTSPLSPDATTYAITNGPTVQAFIVPANSGWTPSPAQVATQINALGLATATNQIGQNTNIPNNIATTGVPLLTNQIVSAQASGVSIAASGELTIPASGTNTLNAIGFELILQAIYATANGVNPFLMVVIDFIDSVTGLLIDQTSYVVTADAFGSAGGAWPTRIKGPTKANTYRINVFNLDNAQAIKLSYSFLLNSRPYTQDAMDWLVSSFIGLPGAIPAHTLAGTIIPDTNTLAVFQNAALAASASDGWLVPPQLGPLYLNIWESGVAGTNIAISVQQVPASVYGVNWLINDIMGVGNPNKYTAVFYSGRAPLQINVKNNGSVAADYIGILTSGVQD